MAASVNAQLVSADALKTKSDWASRHLLGDAVDQYPFSFTVGGTPSKTFLASCGKTVNSTAIDSNRTRHTLIWRDANSDLQVRCDIVDYRDYPTVEWVVWFKNNGGKDSPPVADLKAVDISFSRRRDRKFMLHTIRGSTAEAKDFEVIDKEVAPGSAESFEPIDGRATSGAWPYWNIDWGGEGAIVSVGWPGKWNAKMTCDADTGLSLRGGLGKFNSILHPGEEIRMPLGLVQFWKGEDWIDGQNVWRHFYVDHVMPHPGGVRARPFTATCIDDSFPGMCSNAADTMKAMDIYIKGGIKFDYWWTDAGWYPTPKDWWSGAGTWKPDPVRYPHGLKQVTDHAHKLGMKYVLWFEPERVTVGSEIDREHPQWVLSTPTTADTTRLFDLGNEQARTWMTERIDSLLVNEGIDLYRQDFNMDPAPIWQHNDKPGRTGMTEMKHILGYLAFWDELQRRHPNMLIDTCASGGRRDDLETLRRSLPLLRTDYRFELNGCQAQMYGLSLWVTYHGSGVYQGAPVMMRTHMNAQYGYGAPNILKGELPDFSLMKRMEAEWREIADYFVIGDFYPLTPYTREPRDWIAWQFHDRDKNEGVVQGFRHDASPVTSNRFKLRGLDPAATYTLKNYETGTTQATGRQLMEDGLSIELPVAPDGVNVRYEVCSV